MERKIRLVSVFLLVALLMSMPVAAQENSAVVDLEGSDQGTGMPFVDVSSSAWYCDEVQYVYENGLMQGTSSTQFEPNGITTRAMVVTVLYRIVGSPEAGTAPFSDVSSSRYYAKPVAWAAENEIVNGFPDGTFRPNEEVTREQLVTIIYRFVQYLGGETHQRANLNLYSDRFQVSNYAKPAVKWAVAAGLLNGRTNTTLVPQGSTTRAELAAFLYKFMEKVVRNEAVMHPETANVPVLIFHSVATDQSGAFSITVEEFEAVIKMLYEAGYQTISYQQLIQYVDDGTPLPEKPVIITLDDGYADNLINAYPILMEYGYCCEIAVIGCYVGKNSYDGADIIPHFALEDVLELENGVIGIQSHTMRMHMRSDYADLSQGRRGVAQRPGETDEAYYSALISDFTESYDLIGEALDTPVALTYPHGIFTLESERAAEEVGYRITVSTRVGSNIVTVGNPDSLKLLNRISVYGDTTAEEFEEMIQVK